MTRTRISPRYTLKIPAQFREVIRAGHKVDINSDDQGRLIITPLESPELALQATFGMWSERQDMPADAIVAVDQLRQGNRGDESGA
jgi:virulence-associated protein VagC